MLLKFAIKNYKSFRDETVFSMEPAPKQKDLDYSVLSKKAGRKAYKGLCSAVIYGANASGKTNIIGAMEVLKNIISTGNISNHNINSPNIAVNKLELIPNSNLAEAEPVEFCIKFIEENILFEYKLIIDLGKFLDKEYPRQILHEQLSINEMEIFKREQDNVIVSNLEGIKKLLSNASIIKSKEMEKAAQNNIKPTELYLNNNFKAFYSHRIVDIINNWAKTKFVVVFRGDCVNTAPRTEYKNDKLAISKLINQAAKSFGIDANKVIYDEMENEDILELGSIIQKDDKKILIPAEAYESYGTLRFIDLFPLIAGALVYGFTLVVDELDASIHPMAIMNIINIFHNDEINKNKAQLIFNTHNPIFLDRNLFRRDEIKFVERDEETFQSTHYSLSDFGTSGKEGVRKTGDYMKNYFVSRYGAIRDVDFSDLFQTMVDQYNEGSSINESKKAE